MSRLPAPEPGWDESTEGNLDADLTEEAGSRLDDWAERRQPWWKRLVLPAIALALIAALLGTAMAEGLLGP